MGVFVAVVLRFGFRCDGLQFGFGMLDGLVGFVFGCVWIKVDSMFREFVAWRLGDAGAFCVGLLGVCFYLIVLCVVELVGLIW